MERSGEQFIHQKDTTLHTSKEVEHEKTRKDGKGEKTSENPSDKIADWLKIVEKTHTSHRDDPMVSERIKEYYHKENVIKSEDIPERYFDNLRRIARERGEGDIEITDDMRSQHAEVIVSDQESTLDNWIEYLSSKDSDSFPMWAKYWAFKGMLKLSKYDKEKKAFGKRDRGTVAPFADLNRESLAYAVDAMVKKISKEDASAQTNDPEFKKLLEGANFGKIYAHAIEKATPAEENELINTEGEWIKYNQGSDHMPLVESLQGHGTGWCTAGDTTAKAQLESGDFYIYYSEDKQGSPINPRVAIRMEDGGIAEVRGIADQQNIDSYISETSIVNDKLAEFPDGEDYKKKDDDMKRLTEIHNRVPYLDGVKSKIDSRNLQRWQDVEFTDEELRFLYEIDSAIQGFGYREDLRIGEIVQMRSKKSDIATATGVSREQVSLEAHEAINNGIAYHYGDIIFHKSTYDNREIEASSPKPDGVFEFPEHVVGDFTVKGVDDANMLKLPKTVSGNVEIESIETPRGLELPDVIGGNLNMMDLKSADGLKLQNNVGGKVRLWGLSPTEQDEVMQQYPRLNIRKYVAKD